MKKIILSIFILFIWTSAFGQTGEAIYSISGNSVAIKSKFVDPFYIDNSTVQTPYINKQTTAIIPSSAYGSFSIRTSKFNGYESEPGICNVVEILKNGATILQLANSNGFAKISSYVNTESGDYACVSLSTDTYALIFNEWIYASQPSMVTIILIRNGDAKLVYNKPMFINSIVRQSGSLNIKLQANTSEYVNSNTIPVNTADTHSIWWDGSVLRFQ